MILPIVMKLPFILSGNGCILSLDGSFELFTFVYELDMPVITVVYSQIFMRARVSARILFLQAVTLSY